LLWRRLVLWLCVLWPGLLLLWPGLLLLWPGLLLLWPGLLLLCPGLLRPDRLRLRPGLLRLHSLSGLRPLLLRFGCLPTARVGLRSWLERLSRSL
jgi:hypothetical protein